MKKKALRKDFFMEIRKSLNRFLSITLIVALGVAFYSGIQSAAPDMRYSGDAYFDEHKLMDLKVIGTLGLTQDDVDALSAIDGVAAVEPGYMTDVLCGEDSADVLHLESISPTLNQLTPVEGRLPQASGECFVDIEFLDSSGYQVGDSITFCREEGDDLMLHRDTFTIVGAGSSPLYISFSRGNTTLGNGEITGVGYIPAEDFDSEVYTQIYMSVRGARELTAYTDAYDTLIARVLDRIEAIAGDRCEVRYREVMDEAEGELADAKQELADARTEGESELADALQELQEGESELADGKQELEDAKKELAEGESELAKGEQELADNKSLLQEKERELADGKAQLDSGWAQLAEGKNELAAKESEFNSQYASGVEELDAGEKELNAAKKQLESGKAEYASGLAQYQDGKKQYDAGEAQYASGLAEFQAQEAAWPAQKAELEKQRANLAQNQTQLEGALPQISAALADLQGRQANTQSQRDDLQRQLDGVNAQIASAQQTIDTLGGQIAATQQTVDALAAEQSGLQGSAATLQEQVNACTARASELTAAIAAVTGDSEEENAQRAQLQAELDGVNGQLNACSAELSAAQQRLEAIPGEMAGAQNTLASLQEQLAGAQGGMEQMQASAAQLAGGIAQADSGLAELQKNITDLQSQYDTQAANLEQVKAGIAQIDAGIAQGEDGLAAARQQLADSRAQLDGVKKQLDDSYRQLQDAKKEIAAGEKEIAANEKKLADGRAQLADGKAQIDSAHNTINANEQQLAAAQAEYDSGASQLADGWSQIGDAEQEIADAKKEVEDGKQEIADGEKELADGEKELKDGWKEYEDGVKEFDQKISEAESEIAQAESEIADIKEPEWMIDDRSALPENIGYGENADRMRSLGQVFPVLFFLVAALISLTTMTRMVEEERTQIGTLKALGYGKLSIASKYLCYALFATAAGSVIGILFGEKFLPFVIVTAYRIMYHHMPNVVLPYNMRFAAIATGAALLSTMAGTFAACYKELAATPAILMRPPAPKEGKRVLLEHIPFLWKHLSFSWKSTVRNLFRYKKRFFMTVFGIGGCMALMLVGYGLRDSIVDIVNLQFSELQLYDIMVIMDSEASEAEQDELMETIAGESRIEDYTRILMHNDSVQNGKKMWDLYLMIPEDLETFESFVMFRDRETKETYELSDEGAIITEKIADMMEVGVGDVISVNNEDLGTVEIPIAAVTENYLSHYIYLTPALYEKCFGQKPEYDTVLCRASQDAKEELSSVGEYFLTKDAALSISYTGSIMARLEDMLSALDSVIIVLIVSAGLLAFVVLYNLNNININERKRELATIKVLGFYDGEVSAYVYRENILITIIGILAGAALGIVLHRFTITTVEVDACMFGRNIKLPSFLIAAAFTAGFSIFVNVVMHFKLKKIDMVESLKSVE